MLEQLSYGKQLQSYVHKVEEMIEPQRQHISQIVQHNQYKVIQAFQDQQVGDHHFTPSTGYGYDDLGRETLENVYAQVFGAEAAIVRPQIISGTHAIATALYGILRPGDELLYMTGQPYDTLNEVLGLRNEVLGSRTAEQPARESGTDTGSLAQFNVTSKIIPLTKDGGVDFEQVAAAIKNETKMIGIQRSRGYDDRPSFTVEQIKEMVGFVKEIKEDVIVFVDNCYGEFVEEKEPTEVGVDLMAGSLIKNPGGGLAKSGGYIVGRAHFIERVGTRLFAPGIGLEGGATISPQTDVYQGFFLAPHVVGEALKGAVFTSALLESIGFQTNPHWNEKRTDLIQSVQFNTAEHLVAFCQGVQKASPVNAHVLPYPSAMPGYEDEVIMAAGTFIQGSSIEFSADGPIRPPYLGFVQGGLTYEHVKIGVLTAVNEMLEQQLITV